DIDGIVAHPLTDDRLQPRQAFDQVAGGAVPPAGDDAAYGLPMCLQESCLIVDFPPAMQAVVAIHMLRDRRRHGAHHQYVDHIRSSRVSHENCPCETYWACRPRTLMISP